MNQAEDTQHGQPAIARPIDHATTLKGGSPGGDGLVVRQHERIACRVSVTITPSPNSPVVVKLSREIINGSGGVDAVLVDCSAGGLGLESTVFLPRGASVEVLASFRDPGNGLENFGCSGTIQRVMMVDRTPRYYMGVSFDRQDPASRATAERLLVLARASSGKGATA